MFLAAAVSTLAAASVVRLAARALVDADHRLRLDLLVARGDDATGVAGFVHSEVAQVLLLCVCGVLSRRHLPVLCQEIY